MRDTKKAFIWIINILNKNQVKYRISGGFAAQIYGCKRELADIDIDLSKRYFPKVVNKLKKYSIYGPKTYHDKNWKVLLFTLRYSGQVIDLFETESARIFDKSIKKWVKFNSNFNGVNKMKVLGIKVNVVKKSDLIKYKKKISRRVDKQDVKYLESIG